MQQSRSSRRRIDLLIIYVYVSYYIHTFTEGVQFFFPTYVYVSYYIHMFTEGVQFFFLD